MLYSLLVTSSIDTLLLLYYAPVRNASVVRAMCPVSTVSPGGL